MRHIAKGEAPKTFLDWLARENDEWKPTWESFGGLPDGFERRPKEEVKNALLAEQGALCAYCCESIDETRCHIEHIEPRKGPRGNPDRALDYKNLVASCPGNDADPVLRRTQGRDLHCGARKGDTYDSAQFVSPLDATCESAFVFIASGTIAQSEVGGARAAATITLLNLNARRLRRRRSEAISGTEEVLLSLEPAQRPGLLAGLAQRRSDGTFVEFLPAIRSALEPLFGA